MMKNIMTSILASELPVPTVSGQAPWSAILFDLDGTIANSAPGIMSRLTETLEKLGLPAQSDSELMRWVGPPILDSFRDYAGLNPEQSWDALHVYRGLVGEVGAETGTTIYEGLGEVLARIHATGIPVALATSKPESQALHILEHFGLTDHFTVICGATEDESRSAKADVVAEALRLLREAGADTSNTVLVGDRHHDIDGAAANGVPTILVRWGYGRPEEEAGAIAVVDTTIELLSELAIPENSAPTG